MCIRDRCIGIRNTVELVDALGYVVVYTEIKIVTLNLLVLLLRKPVNLSLIHIFQYTFYLVIRMISSFTVLIEKEQSEGRVDCIIETPMFVYIFEFKRDGDVYKRQALHNHSV